MSYNNVLSTEQIQLINMYNAQYNRTLTQVDRLLDTLDNIRDNIHQIIEQGNSRNNFVRRNRTANNRNRNTFFSTNINDNANMFNILRTRSINPTFVDYLNTSVIIRPTNRQIQNATREIRYRDITNPSNESCPISLDRFEPDDLVSQIIHCGHIFCQSELQEWFQNHVRCPVCRYDIREYETLNTSSANTSVRNTNQPEQIVIDSELDNLTSQIIQSLFLQNRQQT
jgi:hypothetical protein